ncbi:hypothetical protein SAMN05421543_1417 [Alicyclobacillus macrosporangiidus]|uniref:Uncharacterized protein n=1 Tax=Alicyclobacillus macrosporangiidus TaxID=392015 RepID=A0A1I7LEB0_9BACL|nr:hypothetical protein SAMN05421543_1417 [Alicyclobacillus macrosporangiidus]
MGFGIEIFLGRSLLDIINDYMFAIEARAQLAQCPRFRKCKSRKWQRRRNKQFYRILNGLKRLRRDDE